MTTLECSGYVYLLHDPGTGLFKIGKSTDPDRRCEVVGGNLLHVIPSANHHALERYFHDRYAERRAHGEWFALETLEAVEMVKFSDGDALLAGRPVTLAVRLQQLRNASGMSQLDLATKAGLSMSMVSQMEQGLKENPRLETVKKLARALNVTLDELAGDQPSEEPKRRPKK